MFSGGEEESEDDTEEEEEEDAVSSEDDDKADSDDDPEYDGTQSGDESGEEEKGAPLAKKGAPLAKKGAPLAKKGAPLAKKCLPPAQKRSSFFLGGEESAGEESSDHEEEQLEEDGNRTSRKVNISVFKIFHCCIQCSGSGCVNFWASRMRILPSASKKLRNTVIRTVLCLCNNLVRYLVFRCVCYTENPGCKSHIISLRRGVLFPGNTFLY